VAMTVGGFSKGEMNVTPLIDVLLVLIIIFLVIRPPYPTGFEANTPEQDPSNTTTPVRQDIVLTARADGAVMVNQERVDLVNLQARLREIFKSQANALIFVRGDAGVDYALVAQLIDLAKGAGITRFGLMPHAD
jgi:biopolymer transport protein TolR